MRGLGIGRCHTQQSCFNITHCTSWLIMSWDVSLILHLHTVPYRKGTRGNLFILHLQFHFLSFSCQQVQAKVKQSLLQVWTGPEGSRRWRFPDFMTIGTWRFTPRKYSKYSFLVEAESTPGPEVLCQWKVTVTPSGIETATLQSLQHGASTNWATVCPNALISFSS